MQPIFKGILQIAIVVRDIKETAKTYSEKFGIGPWSIWKFGPNEVEDMIIDDKILNHSSLIAACTIKDTEFELMEPLDNLSIYYKFLKKYNEGLHHIEYRVEDYDYALNFLKNRGHKVSQGGNWLGQCKYSNMDTVDDLKHIAEFTKVDYPGLYKTEANKYGNERIIYPEPDLVIPPKGMHGQMIEPVFEKVVKVGYIVKNIKEVIKTYCERYGIGPWKVWELDAETVSDMTIDGRKDNYKMLIAQHDLGNKKIELIEPLDDKGIYNRFLKTKGEGFHHIGYKVKDFDAIIDYFRGLGIKISQSGNWTGLNTFIYFDSEKDLKHIVEINKMDTDFKYPEPLYVYPEL